MDKITVSVSGVCKKCGVMTEEWRSFELTKADGACEAEIVSAFTKFRQTRLEYRFWRFEKTLQPANAPALLCLDCRRSLEDDMEAWLRQPRGRKEEV